MQPDPFPVEYVTANQAVPQLARRATGKVSLPRLFMLCERRMRVLKLNWSSSWCYFHVWRHKKRKNKNSGWGRGGGGEGLEKKKKKKEEQEEEEEEEEEEKDQEEEEEGGGEELENFILLCQWL